MFCNCISMQNYSRLHNKDEKCGTHDCNECLVDELLKESWQEKPENDYLKIAYEKRIIQHPSTSISDLNEEDMKNLKLINYLYVLKAYYIK